MVLTAGHIFACAVARLCNWSVRKVMTGFTMKTALNRGRSGAEANFLEAMKWLENRFAAERVSFTFAKVVLRSKTDANQDALMNTIFISCRAFDRMQMLRLLLKVMMARPMLSMRSSLTCSAKWAQVTAWFDPTRESYCSVGHKYCLPISGSAQSACMRWKWWDEPHQGDNCVSEDQQG